MDPVNEHLEIADLIAKHFRGQLTAHEAAALEAWINASAENKRLWEQLNDSGDSWQRMKPLRWKHGSMLRLRTNACGSN